MTAFHWEREAKSILVDLIKAWLQGTATAERILSEAPATGERQSNAACQGSERAVLAGITNPWLAVKGSMVCSILGLHMLEDLSAGFVWVGFFFFMLLFGHI